MQHTIENILVPIDFGAASLRALSTAIGIARMNRAQVHILHVIEQCDTADAFASANHLQTGAQLGAWLSDAVQHAFDLQPICLQAEGVPHTVISRWLKQNPCDLVVMGMYGRCADSALLVGSTVYQVIKQNACPVLLLPATGIRNCFRKTLYATRPYSGSMALLKFVKCLLPDNAAIEILPYAQTGEQSRSLCSMLAEEASEALADVSLEWNDKWTQLKPSLAHGLMMASQWSEADLLVLTPSLGQVNRLGYVDPEIKDILKNPMLPILYLMNTTLHHKLAQQPRILSTF
jgi:nucleotide-binding universal stress UspA family protein